MRVIPRLCSSSSMLLLLLLLLPMVAMGFHPSATNSRRMIRIHQPPKIEPISTDIGHPMMTMTKVMGMVLSSSSRQRPSSSTRLEMQKRSSGGSPSSKASSSSSSSSSEPPMAMPGFNVGLIVQNLLNQALLGSTIWFQGPQYDVLTSQAQFGPIGIGLGIAGLVPLLLISRQIEKSDAYLVSGLNLSTNMAVLRLFGSTPQPVLAGVASLVMSGLTGVVEETTFRGQLLPFFANRFGGGDELIGLVLSSLLFAVLHTNPQAFLKGGEAFLDNAVLLGLQFVNGSIFGLLYLTSGGNLAVPIVAHFLYDFYTFYKTHMVDVAGQMEYASQEALMPNIKNKALEKKWIAERGQDFVTGVKQSFYLMDTNRDGVLSPRELRIALFSYGINLSQAQTDKVAIAADLDEDSTIDLDEFLAFVGPTKGSTAKAVRYTLFGPI